MNISVPVIDHETVTKRQKTNINDAWKKQFLIDYDGVELFKTQSKPNVNFYKK
ncbi:MAG: hypothetical protein ACI936_002693 [Paraglaciecola sp.]|jgi:hypothetical protein